MESDRDEFRALIARAKEGDSAAFGELYQKWYAPLYRFILARIYEETAAEDLTQDVFMKLFAHLDRFEMRDAHPLGFLFTSARNAVIDYRKKKKSPSLEALELPEPADETARSPEEDASLRIDSAHLRAALLKLTDEQQLIVTLRLIEEKPVREVADALGKSEEAVRQAQVRALRALRAHMQPYV
jgi:RNA polymerase sigma-70 factor, ECF subfamily